MKHVILCLALLLLSPLPALAADLIYTAPPLTTAQRDALTRSLDRRWDNFQKKGAGMAVRDLFAFSLESAESDYRLDRIDGALALAEPMQDRDPNSPTYGNFKWRWGDAGPDDRNAVEFSMQDGALLWMRHRDRLAPEARQRLERLIRLSIEGIHRHRVAVSYTNIFLMKTWNCIALGEHTDRPELAKEGYALFDAWLMYTWENGIHEYLSPTYYGVDLDSLVLIARFTQNERARQQAEAALRLFWTDIAANWFEPGQRLGGSHSRDYDYLTGHGALDPHLIYAGWLKGQPDQPPSRFAALGGWRPPAELRAMAVSPTPRMIRQKWGPLLGERSAQFVGRTISLGSAGATYGNMDKPLTVNFAGGPKMPMVNFFMDARDDPFGAKREVTGGGHLKSLHLSPFLMSVQREREVLLLAASSPEDASFRRNAPNPTCLLSQLVLPRDGVSVWIGDEPSSVPKRRIAQPVAIGQPLFVRFGNAAAGFRVIHALDLQGNPAAIALANDGNNLGAMTLTVTHSAGKSTRGRASAALWTRVAEDLDDAQFATFRADFARAAARAQYNGEILDVSAQGERGPLRLMGNLKLNERMKCEGDEPGAADRLLAINGRDMGREILKDVEPVKTLSGLLDPASGAAAAAVGKPFEVERAPVIIPPFEVGEDPSASGGKFIWMPGQPSGQGGSEIARAIFPTRLPAAGTYYVWGRVLTPTSADDSFYVWIRNDKGDLLPRTEWPLGVHKAWEWVALELEPRQERGVSLPGGVVLVEIFCREDGAKIDELLITSDAKWRP
jgi:hypothetical protein